MNFKKPDKLAKGQGGDERNKQKNTLLTTENQLIPEEGEGDGESGDGDSGGHLWPVPGVATKS